MKINLWIIVFSYGYVATNLLKFFSIITLALYGHPIASESNLEKYG